MVSMSCQKADTKAVNQGESELASYVKGISLNLEDMGGGKEAQTEMDADAKMIPTP